MLSRSLTLLFCSAASLVQAWPTYVVPHTPGADDTAPLLGALANLTTNTTILFQKGVTYNLSMPIKFPVLTNVEISIQGNISLPEDIATVQALVANATVYGGSWWTFAGGSNVTLVGSTDPNWGWIDAHGQAWWDAQQQTNRPHAVAFAKIKTGVIKNMKMYKPIGWVFSTSGTSDAHIHDNKIVAGSSTDSFPFNTDGFSAGGTNMLFERNWVQNGDDCLTVGSGAINVTFKDAYCEGGHGLSIGSLGSGGSVANVQNILIENAVMKNSLYGARFKSWTGGNGLARNITWKNIAFDNVPFPIYVTQNYWDQESGPKPNGTTTNNTHIADFLFQNFVGTILDKPYIEGSCVTDPCWYAVTNATGKEVIILDLYPGTATNILAKDIFARTETGAPVAVMCNATTVTNDVGFKCWNGKFIPDKAGLL